MIEQLNDYDWREAFGYAGETNTEGTPGIRGALPTENYNLSPFSRDDVAEIYGISEGENDEASWLIYGRLHDGRFFYLEAWCDYTGWDCQAGGSATIANSKSEIERFGLTAEARERFGITLEAI